MAGLSETVPSRLLLEGFLCLCPDRSCPKIKGTGQPRLPIAVLVCHQRLHEKWGICWDFRHFFWLVASCCLCCITKRIDIVVCFEGVHLQRFRFWLEAVSGCAACMAHGPLAPTSGTLIRTGHHVHAVCHAE